MNKKLVNTIIGEELNISFTFDAVDVVSLVLGYEVEREGKTYRIDSLLTRLGLSILLNNQVEAPTVQTILDQYDDQENVKIGPVKEEHEQYICKALPLETIAGGILSVTLQEQPCACILTDTHSCDNVVADERLDDFIDQLASVAELSPIEDTTLAVYTSISYPMTEDPYEAMSIGSIALTPTGVSLLAKLNDTQTPPTLTVMEKCHVVI